MPDLNIETRRTCSSNLNWQTTVGKYVVRYGETSEPADYVYDWSCTCKAFEFGKGKHCKHIESVKSQRCSWGAEAFCGDCTEVNPDGTCPGCGGPTEVIRVGV